jgi:transcriptional regulator with XRE-family HTH domain
MIGATISRIRRARRLSRPALAAMAGISREHLWGIERERYTPSLMILGEIAAALDIGLTSFFRDHDEAFLLLQDPLIRTLSPVVKNLSVQQREQIVKTLRAIGN